MRAHTFVLACALALLACTGQPASTPSPTPAEPSSTPSPLPSATPTVPATTRPTATASATEVATTEPTATETATPAPAIGWTGPVEIAGGKFADGAVTFDAVGGMHIAVAGLMNGRHGNWYGTNRGSDWTWTLLPGTPTTDGVASAGASLAVRGQRVETADTYGEDTGELAIATDDAGTAWIAYTYLGSCRDCTPRASDGVFYSTNGSGRWSKPARLAGEMFGQSSIAARDAHLYLACADNSGIPGPRGEVRYGTDASGTWQSDHLADRGNSPLLYLDSTGRPTVVFFDGTTHVATAPKPASAFEVTDLGGPPTGEYEQLSAVGPAGDIWIAVDNTYSVFNGDSWSAPTEAIADGNILALEVGSGGVAHFLARSEQALVYGRVAGDQVTGAPILDSGWDIAWLALDPIGTPHVIFAGTVAGTVGLFEMVGPAAP